MQVSHLCTLLPVHMNTQKHRLTHANTFTHALPPLSPCPMWAVASAAGASDCCHGVKHRCNPSGFNQLALPACTMQSTLLPSQLLSTGVDRRQRRRQRNKHRQTSYYLMEWELTHPCADFQQGSPIPSSFAATNCRTITPGVIIVTHRIITCAQTQAG